MIKVTQINNKEVVVNAELISLVEFAANTIITLTTGNKIVVRETPDEVIAKVVAYKKSCQQIGSVGIP